MCYTRGEGSYVEGLNVDPIPFNPQPCVAGGLHFSECPEMWAPYYVDPLIADVEVPLYAKVSWWEKKSKANKLLLSNIRPVKKYLRGKSDSFLRKWLRASPSNIKYMRKSPVLCKYALSKCRLACEVKNVVFHCPNTSSFRMKVVQHPCASYILDFISLSERTPALLAAYTKVHGGK
jgi:hypothetical protein